MSDITIIYIFFFCGIGLLCLEHTTNAHTHTTIHCHHGKYWVSHLQGSGFGVKVHFLFLVPSEPEEKYFSVTVYALFIALHSKKSTFKYIFSYEESICSCGVLELRKMNGNEGLEWWRRFFRPAYWFLASLKHQYRWFWEELENKKCWHQKTFISPKWKLRVLYWIN